MKDDTTVDELLDLLQAIARWFFWQYGCGELEAADDPLDELLERILHSDQTKELVRAFSARLGERQRAASEAPQHQRDVLKRNFEKQRQVLEWYAIGQAERAVERHLKRQAIRRWEQEIGNLRPLRSRAAPRVPERVGSEPGTYDPQQHLKRALLALALAGIEDPPLPLDNVLVPIG